MVVNNNAKLKLRRHNQIRVHTRIKTTLLSPRDRNRNRNRNREHTMLRTGHTNTRPNLISIPDGYYIDLTDKSINFIGHLRKKLERKIYKPDVHKIIMDSIECSMFIFNSNDKRTM